MAGLRVYKLDNGASFPTNCFPVRSLFQQSREGVGHWFIAHRSSVENRYWKAKQPSSADPFHTASSVLSESEKLERKTPENAESTLNTQLLMKLHCVDKPSDLCSVDISERKLDSVTLEGLEEFDSVAYINASDNHLTLDSFSCFPALRELELSLNCLGTLEVHAVDFPKLQVLDLSYNYLSSDAVLALGLLPCLKVLHLTGNHLQMLPLNMAGPHTPPDELASQPRAFFQNLEVLMLDDNQFSSPEVFNSLANLKRLQHLNLEGNCISGVPYLQPILTASVPQSQATTVETTLTRGFSDHHLNTEVVNLESEEFSPPLPQLQYLNLAHNKIAEEEALLAVALFPLLSELIIHSNPLTTHRTGDQPVLTWFLQDRLGINIVRKKSTVLKPHLVLPVDPKRKVITKIPKVPKVPLIAAAVCPSETPTTAGGAGRSSPVPSDWMSNNASLLSSPSTSTVELENDGIAAGGPEIMHQVDEPFFVTEINDLLESEDKEGMISVRECPEKLIGFEALLDDDDDDDDDDSQCLDIPEPAGIQQTVRVLEHKLKNLLVYRFSREDLESLQRPHRGQQKMNLPPAKSFKPNKENVKEILTEMKEWKSITEVPLEKVLQNRDKYRKEYEEALTLLKDMKRKYKMVFVKAAEHAAQIESISQSSE